MNIKDATFTVSEKSSTTYTFSSLLLLLSEDCFILAKRVFPDEMQRYAAFYLRIQGLSV